MEAATAEWDDPQLITLTVDRTGDGARSGRHPRCKGFASPEAAWDRVNDGRLIARLMRELGICRWIQVPEAHPDAPEWMHWHVLVDWPGFIPFKRAWRIWADRWGIGRPDFALMDDRLSPRDRLRRYVFKLGSYLSKATDLPTWLKCRRGVRLVSCSRCVMGIDEWSRGGKRVRSPDRHPDEVSQVDRRRSLAERVGACGQSSRVFSVYSDPASREVVCRTYMGTVPVPLELLASSVRGVDLDVSGIWWDRATEFEDVDLGQLLVRRPVNAVHDRLRGIRLNVFQARSSAFLRSIVLRRAG